MDGGGEWVARWQARRGKMNRQGECIDIPMTGLYFDCCIQNSLAVVFVYETSCSVLFQFHSRHPAVLNPSLTLSLTLTPFIPSPPPQALGDCQVVQDAVAKLCCTWWALQAPGRGSLMPQTLPYILVSSLGLVCALGACGWMCA